MLIQIQIQLIFVCQIYLSINMHSISKYQNSFNIHTFYTNMCYKDGHEINGSTMSDLETCQKDITTGNKISKKGREEKIGWLYCVCTVLGAEIMLVMADVMLCIHHSPLLRALAHLLCSTTGKGHQLSIISLISW